MNHWFFSTNIKGVIGIIILLIVLAIIFSWLLFAPFVISINSAKNDYGLKWGGIIAAKIYPLSKDILVQFRFLFWQKDFYPLHTKFVKKPKPESKPNSKDIKKKRNTTFRRRISMGKQLISSFKIKTFRLNLDTDDYVMNAYLSPVFYFLNKTKGDWAINFEGSSEIELVIENKGIRVLRAILF